MAKPAAETVRLDEQDRSWLIHKERQLCELCVFLERLAHAANNHALPDGKVMRDFDGIWRTRSNTKKFMVVRLKGFPVKPADPVYQVAQLGASPTRPALGNPPSEWMDSWRRSCSKAETSCSDGSGQTWVKRALARVIAAQ